MEIESSANCDCEICRAARANPDDIPPLESDDDHPSDVYEYIGKIRDEVERRDDKKEKNVLPKADAYDNDYCTVFINDVVNVHRLFDKNRKDYQTLLKG